LDGVESKLYLDFGGALAAIGLLIAVYQLRQPSWEVVLRVRPRWQICFPVVFATLGFALTLLTAILDRVKPCWPFGLAEPFGYQVAAYIAFAIAPVSLLLVASVRCDLFSRRNAVRFYRELSRHMANTGERVAIVDVLLDNFRTICKYAVGVDDGKVRRAARHVIDVVLSDDGVAKELTTRRLLGTGQIFIAVARSGLSKAQVPTGINALMRSLYVNGDSFLYKQYRADGLALALNIYKVIFGSPALLTNFKLFGYGAVDYKDREQIGASGTDIYIEALTRGIETYLTTGKVPAESINQGVKYLSEVMGDLCGRIPSTPYSDGVRPRTPTWEAIQKISDFFGRDLLYIVPADAWNARVRDAEESAEGEGFDAQFSISPAIAKALADGFTQLAIVNKNTDFEWSYPTSLELLHGLMFDDVYISNCYRPKFEKGIWEKIKTNVIRGWYPAALRTYLQYFGFALIFNRPGGLGVWVQTESERVRRLLYVDLQPLFAGGAKMIDGETMEDALLPPVMSYREGKFYYKTSYGKGQDVEIERPQGSAESALLGVKDDFDRWEEQQGGNGPDTKTP